MKIIVSNHFFRFKKKSSEKLQLEIDNQVSRMVENPAIGELKKSDLKGIRVHKFTHKTQLFLISYEFSKDVLYLYTIGSHKNFYKKLKRYL